MKAPAWLSLSDGRTLLLISLTLEIVLTFLGSRRRYIAGHWIRLLVLCAYSMADWVAIMSLAKLTNTVSWGDSDPALGLLWAPLVLVHLGSPDTIVAYSFRDVQDWFDHAIKLLKIVVKVCIIIFIFHKYWTGSWLSSLAFPIFVAGITKYGERVWVLWSTSIKPPGSDTSLPQVKADEVLLAKLAKAFPSLHLLLAGYFIFQKLQPHVANYIDRDSDILEVQNATFEESTENAFKVIEYELGFFYDLLYTKASITYTKAGCILRAFSFFCMVSALLGFSLLTKKDYSNFNVFITYLLLVGAILLDIYAIIVMLISDWAMLLMHKYQKNEIITQIFQFLAPISLKKRKRWSNSMAQISLLSYCLSEGNSIPCSRILKLFGIHKKLKAYRRQKTVNIPDELKELMIKRLRFIAGQIVDLQPFPTRGEWTCGWHRIENLEWSVRVDFEESVLIWHIATDICYYSDLHRPQKMYQTKMLSDYMMYLLFRRPDMLSIATWHYMSTDITCNDIKKKFKKRGSSPVTAEAQALVTTLTQVSSTTTEAPISRGLLTEVLSALSAEAQACRTLQKETSDLEEGVPRLRFTSRRSALKDASKLAKNFDGKLRN